MAILKISKDFSKTPGGRYRSDGCDSAEEFRDDILVPMVMDHFILCAPLIIDLDGVAGYARTFIEEAFGGMFRGKGKKYVPKDVRHCLMFKSVEEPYLIDEIWADMNDAIEHRERKLK